MLNILKVIKKTKGLLKFTANLPLILFQLLNIRNKKLWVFGAWFGNKYADNSKYLFEYVNENCPEIRAIWLSQDENTIKLIKSKGYEVYYTYSFWGYFYSIFARYGFISTGYSDINIFTNFNRKTINLWHGIPLKKVVKDDKITNKQTKYGLLIQKIYEHYFSTIATSDSVKEIYESAFDELTKQIDIIGQPRCDAFYLPVEDTDYTKKLKLMKDNNYKIGIYMPTHRKEGKVNFSNFLIDELENINNKMKELNTVLLVKLHYYHQKDIDDIKKDYSNILFVKDDNINQDIYSILNLTDFLITDYSSIYFDYLHSKKPIIFYPFDKEDYLSTDREFYFNYDENTPGEKAYNWDQLYKLIEKTLNKIDFPETFYKKINDKFNLYQDGKNCKRVVEFIRSLD